VVLTARNGTLSSTESQGVSVTAPAGCVGGNANC
jgi:hypothetical protein